MNLLREYCFKTLKQIGKQIEEIIKFIFLPFTMLYTLCLCVNEFCTKYLKTDITELLKVFRIPIVAMGNGLTELSRKYHSARLYKTYKSVLNRMTLNKHTVFQNTFDTYSTLFATTALQFVSFFTTLAGTKYYFYSVNPLAPLLITLVIQGSLLMYSNTAFSHVGSTKKRKLGLLVMTMVSFYFSYTGIINAVVSPENDYKAAYEHFYYLFDETSRDIKKSYLDNSNAQSQIESFYMDANTLLTSLDGTIQMMQTELDEISSISQYRNNVTTRADGTVSRTKEENESYINAQNRITQLREQLSLLSGYQNSLRQGLEDETLNAAAIENLFQNYMKDGASGNADHQLSEVNQSYVRLTEYYNAAKDAIGNGNGFRTWNLNLYDLYKKAWEYEILAPIVLKSYSELHGGQTLASKEDSDGFAAFFEKIPFLNLLLKQESTVEKLTASARQLEQEAESVFIKFKTAEKTVDSDTAVKLEELENAYASTFPLEDVNLIAIKRLNPADGYFFSALFSLCLAIMIDGGTVLIAYIGERKRYCSFQQKQGKDILNNEEDLLAVVFLSMRKKGYQKIYNQTTSYEKDNLDVFTQVCEEYIHSVIASTREYLFHFKPSPWTSKLGYGLYAECNTLDQNPEYTPLTSLLYQLSYVKMVTRDEFHLLQDSYLGYKFTKDEIDIIDGEGRPDMETERPNNNYAYLLKYRYENWSRENISDLEGFYHLNETIQAAKEAAVSTDTGTD